MPRPDLHITVGGTRTKHWSDEDITTVTLETLRTYDETVVGSNWQKWEMKRRKWSDPSAYSLAIIDNRRPYGTVKLSQLKNYWGLTSGVLTSVDIAAPTYNSVCTEGTMKTISQSIKTRAVLAARAALKGQKVNLGVAFGEHKKTAYLVGTTAKNIATSIRSLKKGRVRQAMNALGISSRRREPRGNSVPKKWLELQYGWKPLLNDVYGAVSALSQKEKAEWRVTAHGRAQDVKISQYAENPPHPTSNFGAGWTRAESLFKGHHVRIDAIPDNELKSSLSSLGISNPLEVVWELVPFSFVVDWFLPIGDWLHGTDALLGYTNVVQVDSSFVRAEWSKGGISEHWSQYSYQENNYSALKKAVWLDRTISFAPMPAWPGFKDPRSLGHLANGLSLLTQVFGKSHNPWKYIR